MSKLFCGAAKECITPSAALLPHIYGLMRSHYAGVIDDIYVRVMIIGNETDKAMFVSWDLDKAPDPDAFVPELSALTGIADDRILFFSIHTHTAPLHSDRPYDGPNAKAKQTPEVIAATNEYEALLLSAVENAASKALASLQPSRIGWNTGMSYVGECRVHDYYVENPDGSIRREAALGSNPTKEIDHTLFVMRAETLDGSPIAFFINHAVHACVMILNNLDGKGGNGISGDIPGAVCRYMEQKYPGAVALWSSGAAGDINPVMLNQYNIADPVTGEHLEFMDYKSAEPAKMMLLVMGTRHYADILQVNRDLICNITDADISGTHEVAATPANDGGEPYHVILRGLKIGDLAFFGASGELYNSLGTAIQRRSGFDHTVIINHERSVNFESGYIFDDETLAQCTREDGTLDGVPSIAHARMQPGYIRPALEEAADKIFSRLKA